MNLFPRETHLKPFLLLDGHGSRLQLPFLQYIHSEEHPWHVCLGLPYGTSFWQVGDSSEQNGAFKMNLTKAKRELVHKKWRCGMSKDARVEKHDIMLIVSQAWDKSFGWVATNQKAIAARGWNPLTRNLLDNKELRSTMTSEDLLSDGVAQDLVEDTENRPPTEALLTLHHGYIGEKIADIIQYADRAAVRQTILQRQEVGREATEVLRETRRQLTAGALYRQRRVHLGREVLESCQLNRDLQEQMAREKEEKKQEAIRKKYEEVERIRALPYTEVGWNVKQFRTMVSYKMNTSRGVPTSRAALQQKWEEVKNLPSPARNF